MMMKERGVYQPIPRARDGRWVVTLNRRFIFAGKVGWVPMTVQKGLPPEHVLKYYRPSSNACLYESKEAAEAVAVAETLLEGTQAKRLTGETRYLYVSLEDAHRRSSHFDSLHRVVEAGLIRHNVTVWEPRWVLVDYRGVVLRPDYSPVRPGHPGTGDVMQQAMLFADEAEAEEYCRKNRERLAVLALGAKPRYMDEFGNLRPKE